MVDVLYNGIPVEYGFQLIDQPVDELISCNPRIRAETSYSEISCAWQKTARDEASNGYVSEACRYLNTPPCKLVCGSTGKRDVHCRGEGRESLQIQNKRTCAHHPLTVIADSNTLAGLFILEIL